MTSFVHRAAPHVGGILLVLTLVTSQVWCGPTEDRDVSEDDQAQEIPQGIARLLFKHLRFRELPEASDTKGDQFESSDLKDWQYPDPDSKRSDLYQDGLGLLQSPYHKRHQELVKNIAELLADASKNKNSGGLRMPSLRFG